MINLIKGWIAFIFFCIQVLAMVFLIGTFFGKTQQLKIVPLYFQILTKEQLDQKTIFMQIIIKSYNSLISCLIDYQNVTLFVSIIILGFFIIYSITMLGYDKLILKSKYDYFFLILKIMVNGLSLSVAFSYLHLMWLINKLSDDVVANFILFKIMIIRTWQQKQYIFYNGLSDALNNTELKYEDALREKLLVALVKKFKNDWPEAHTANMTSKELYDYGYKKGLAIFNAFEKFVNTNSDNYLPAQQIYLNKTFESGYDGFINNVKLKIVSVINQIAEFITDHAVFIILIVLVIGVLYYSSNQVKKDVVSDLNLLESNVSDLNLLESNVSDLNLLESNLINLDTFRINREDLPEEIVAVLEQKLFFIKKMRASFRDPSHVDAYFINLSDISISFEEPISFDAGLEYINNLNAIINLECTRGCVHEYYLELDKHLNIMEYALEVILVLDKKIK
jgi:hypothetical protein